MTAEQRERARIRASEWYYANPERARASRRAWSKSNPGKKQEYAHMARLKGPEKAREYMREWKRRNPERVKANAARTYATMRRRLFDVLGGVCGTCGFDDARALHLAHIVPVRRVVGKRYLHDSGVGLARKLSKLPAEAVRAEVKALCANCHTIETWEKGEWSRGDRKR